MHATVCPSPGAPWVLALCGGVGGAKLAWGLEQLLRSQALGALRIVVNTGDDFEHLGLHIAPDIDTVLYTLAGLNDPVRGWGRQGETWNFMAALTEWGADDWFALGDRDLALHVERTRRLRAGETLAQVTADLARRSGVQAMLLPMSERPVRTIVHTQEGDLPLQHYFVRHACRPVVTGVSFAGAATAPPHPALLAALADPALAMVVICPSNPLLSIDPILALPGVRAALRASRAPVVAVSPLIGGQAVKGPTAKMLRELGHGADNRTVAEHYAGLLDGLVVDHADAAQALELGIPVHAAATLMDSPESKRALAQAVVGFAQALTRPAAHGVRHA
nr:2-phospho-L-lactate transferase [Delftia acidovorans]